MQYRLQIGNLQMLAAVRHVTTNPVLIESEIARQLGMEGKAATPCATTYLQSQKKRVTLQQLLEQVEHDLTDVLEVDEFLQA